MNHSFSKTLIWIGFLASSLAATSAHADDHYKKLDRRCSTCQRLSDVLGALDKNPTNDNGLDASEKVAKIIEGMNIKSKKELEQKREIYWALNSAVEVLTYDHDSQTVFNLIGLREQAENQFDYVFHRFPKSNQIAIVERMKAFQEAKIKPNLKVPEIKELD